MWDETRVNALFQTQGPREKHEKNKNQSETFEPALNLAHLPVWGMISFTEQAQKTHLPLKTSQIL